MALVLALYLLLCVRVTADVCAGAAKGQIVFSADVGALMFHAQVNDSARRVAERGLGIDCAAHVRGAGGRGRNSDARGRRSRVGGRPAGRRRTNELR